MNTPDNDDDMVTIDLSSLSGADFIRLSGIAYKNRYRMVMVDNNTWKVDKDIAMSLFFDFPEYHL